MDFGDAPAPYPTLSEDNGASHEEIGPTLGATRDTEPNGQATVNAMGDGADEDGVTFGSIMVGQLDAAVTVKVQNAPTGAKLDAWIDFNSDGSWGGPSEHIFYSTIVTAGETQLQFDVPSWAVAGETYARFRLSSVGDLAPIGEAVDGEVEDYEVVIAPPARAHGEFGPQIVISNNGDVPDTIVAADMDDDGDMDIVAKIGGDDFVAWYENNGNQEFEMHEVRNADPGQGASELTVADMNGDGHLDIVSFFAIQDRSADPPPRGEIYWHEGHGDGNFTNHLLWQSADYVMNSEGLSAADIDLDGDLDLVSSTANGFPTPNQIVWFENRDGQFSANTIENMSAIVPNQGAADLDADSDVDFVTLSFDDSSGDVKVHIDWYENLGIEGFAQRRIATDIGISGDLVVADVDQDGHMDVVAFNNRAEIVWYENDGQQAFTPHHIAFGEDFTSLFASDLDGDGDIDVVSGAFEHIRWHENDGNQEFTSRQITTDADRPFGLFVADMDKDGDADVLSASAFDDKIAWYENKSATSEIHGIKWNDLNADGERGPSEPGLEGWTIFLDEDGDSELDNDEPFTMTDANGAFLFTELSEGRYAVAEVQRAGWMQTSPNATGDFLGAIISEGSGGLDGPSGMTVGPDGNLYVVSRSSDEVLRYNVNSGAFLDVFVESDELGLPVDLTFGPDGNLYVGDARTDNIIKFDGTTGEFLDVFVAEGQVRSPGRIMFRPDGNLYVVDISRSNILRFSGATGELIDEFIPSGRGGLSGARDFDFDSRGDILVSSLFTGEVLQFDGATGDFAQVAASGGGLEAPEYSRFGPDGNLYVADEDRVLRFSNDGRLIDEYVTSGSGGLEVIHGILFAEDGSLYLSSLGSNEVLRFRSPMSPGIHRVELSVGQVASGIDFGSHSPTASPMVLSITVNEGLNDPADLATGPQPTNWLDQRSDLRSITIAFSEPAIVSVNDLVLANLGVNAPVDADTLVSLSEDQIATVGSEVTISFDSYQLPNGIYQLEVLQSVTDLTGNSMTSDHVLTGSMANRFYKLAGDWSGDAGVSIFDFPVLAYWFGQSLPAAPQYVDLSRDAGVSIFDFSVFATNFGTGITDPTGLFFGQHIVDASFIAGPIEVVVNQGRRESEDARIVHDAAILAWLVEWNQHQLTDDPLVDRRQLRERQLEERERQHSVWDPLTLKQVLSKLQGEDLLARPTRWDH